ncbi:MAG TPA: Fic/DOC family N-terminal domain-containing protein [Planctomycetota bacterium]|nr:Fic/DOC family N-terminal domain-containing protein [Planctomycetota bacterium]
MKPYRPQQLPLSGLHWKPLIRLIGPANAELARFDGVLQTMINPELLLSPLRTQEAVLSSRIEGTQATLREVLEFEATREEKPEKAQDIQEIINYRTALQTAVESLDDRPISLNMIKQIHSILLDTVRGRDRARGLFRTQQNWIGRPGSPIEQASYVPPPPLGLMAHLDNLEKYVHHDEVDRLVQLAIVHAQFELIHPFLDGNGRVGRILIPLFLYEKKLLSSPMFYLSAYLEANRDAYYDRLQGISDHGDWEGWIQFFLTAIIEQAKANSDKAKAVLDLYDEMKQEISRATRSQFAIQALDALFHMPVFTRANFIRHSGIPKTSADRVLHALINKRHVARIRDGGGQRPIIFRFGKLLKLLEN